MTVKSAIYTHVELLFTRAKIQNETHTYTVATRKFEPICYFFSEIRISYKTKINHNLYK